MGMPLTAHHYWAYRCINVVEKASDSQTNLMSRWNNEDNSTSCHNAGGKKKKAGRRCLSPVGQARQTRTTPCPAVPARRYHYNGEKVQSIKKRRKAKKNPAPCAHRGAGPAPGRTETRTLAS